MLDAQQAGARPCGNAVLDSVDAGFDGINGVLGFNDNRGRLNPINRSGDNGDFHRLVAGGACYGRPGFEEHPYECGCECFFPAFLKGVSLHFIPVDIAVGGVEIHAISGTVGGTRNKTNTAGQEDTCRRYEQGTNNTYKSQKAQTLLHETFAFLALILMVICNRHGALTPRVHILQRIIACICVNVSKPG